MVMKGKTDRLLLMEVVSQCREQFIPRSYYFGQGNLQS